MDLGLYFDLSAIAKTIPTSLFGRISPENLGSVISNKASAIWKNHRKEKRIQVKIIIEISWENIYKRHLEESQWFDFFNRAY